MSEYPYDIEYSQNEVLYIPMKLKMVRDEIYENNIQPLQMTRSLQPFIGKLLRLYFIEPEVYDLCNKYLDTSDEADIREQLNKVLRANARANSLVDQLSESFDNGVPESTSELSAEDFSAFDAENAGSSVVDTLADMGVLKKHNSPDLQANIADNTREIAELKSKISNLYTMLSSVLSSDVKGKVEVGVVEKNYAERGDQRYFGDEVALENQAEVELENRVKVESDAKVSEPAVPVSIEPVYTDDIVVAKVGLGELSVASVGEPVSAVSEPARKSPPPAFLKAVKSIKG